MKFTGPLVKLINYGGQIINIQVQRMFGRKSNKIKKHARTHLDGMSAFSSILHIYIHDKLIPELLIGTQ